MADKVQIDVELNTARAEAQQKKLREHLQGLEEEMAKLRAEHEGLAKKDEEFVKRSPQKTRRGAAALPGFVENEVAIRETRQQMRLVGEEIHKAKKKISQADAGDPETKQSHVERMIAGKGKTVKQATNEAYNELRSFQRKLRHDAVTFQGLSRALIGPVPGGHIALGGISGFMEGYGEGRMEIDPETGQPRLKKGIGGMLGGLGKGLKSAGWAMLVQALASGAGAMFSGGRKEENVARMLGRATGGNMGYARTLHNEVFGENGLSEQEGAGLTAAMFKATGDKRGLDQVLRAETIAGEGHSMAGLAGATARTGGRTDERMWIDIFSAGVSQGLEKGRLHELIAGATAMANQRTFGVSMGNTRRVMELSTALGQDKAFRGESGMRAAGILEQMAMGKTGGSSEALSLLANGFGSGKSYVRAKMQMEQGLFGENSDPKALQNFMGRFQSAYGKGSGDNQIMAMHLASGGQLSMTAAEKILKLQEGGKLDAKAMQSIIKESAPIEQQAYQSMVKGGGAWENMDKNISRIEQRFGLLADNLGVPNLIGSGAKAVGDALGGDGGVSARSKIDKANSITKRVREMAGDRFNSLSPAEFKDLYSRAQQEQQADITGHVRRLQEMATPEPAMSKAPPTGVQALRQQQNMSLQFTTPLTVRVQTPFGEEVQKANVKAEASSHLP